MTTTKPKRERVKPKESPKPSNPTPDEETVKRLKEEREKKVKEEEIIKK